MGLIPAVAIMATLKIVCDQVDALPLANPSLCPAAQLWGEWSKKGSAFELCLSTLITGRAVSTGE
jgi:hypothetical protein